MTAHALAGFRHHRRGQPTKRLARPRTRSRLTPTRLRAGVGRSTTAVATLRPPVSLARRVGADAADVARPADRHAPFQARLRALYSKLGYRVIARCGFADERHESARLLSAPRDLVIYEKAL